MTLQLKDEQCAFNGTIHLPVDGESEHVPLDPPDADGNRFMYLCCCDCGLVHRIMIGPNSFQVCRATDDEAVVVRGAARAAGHTFPLARAEGDAATA